MFFPLQAKLQVECENQWGAHYNQTTDFCRCCCFKAKDVLMFFFSHCTQTTVTYNGQISLIMFRWNYVYGQISKQTFSLAKYVLDNPVYGFLLRDYYSSIASD